MAEMASALGAGVGAIAEAEDSADQLSAGGLTSGEEGQEEASLTCKPKDHAEVLAAVKKQIEFYFSDANLPTDKHLLKQIQKDHEGYVPLRMIANFKRVKALTKDLSIVAEALKSSTLLSLDDDGSRVRRATPLPAFDVNDITRRTVVVEHLPDKPTIESVTQLLSQYGDVVMVRICSRGNSSKLPAWLAKAVDAMNVTMAPGEFALVEFCSEEDCVVCVSKTKNPDNWRTSLRVRHLLTNFKPTTKGSSRPSSRSSLDHGSRHEAEGHGKGQQYHGREREHSTSGDGRRNTASGRRPSHDGKRTSHDGQHHQQQLDQEDNNAAAAAAVAVAGMPVSLAPIRTQTAASNSDGQRTASPYANGAGRANDAASPLPGLSPMKQLSGVGGAIGSPRAVRSPAPPEVTSFIDSILSAPTASTPVRDGRGSSGGAQEGRWGNSSGGDWGGSSSAVSMTPAAAVAAALAGVSTPPQGSPRHSLAGASTRSSHTGGAAAPGTPTRLSTSTSGTPATVSSQNSLAAAQGALAQQLAAAAAAAAQAAMAGSPRATQGSNAANWRSTSIAGGVSVSAPNTPLAGMSAGDAVAAALEASLGLGISNGGASNSRPIPVGSPELGSSPKPGPWIPASRLHHMQQAAAAHDAHNAVRSSGSDAEDNAGSWRSSWSGQAGSLPGSGMKPPKPRTSGGGAAQAGGRQRRRSWHANEGEGAAGDGSSSDSGAAAAAAAVAATGRGSSSGGRRTSRLAQPSGDHRPFVEAIKEGSCEDLLAAADAAAAGSVSKHTQQRRSSHSGEQEGKKDAAGEHDSDNDPEDEGGELEHGKRRRRRRRSGAGNRRASLDEPHPVSASGECNNRRVSGDGGGSGRRASSDGSRRRSIDEGHSRRRSIDESGSRRRSLDESGCPKPCNRSHSKAGAISPTPEEAATVHSGGGRGSHGGSKPHSHHGSPSPVSHMGAAADHGKEGKKKEKKDYASWAAATPEFRAAAAAAKQQSGGGNSNSCASGGSAGLLGTSPGRAGLSPLRASMGGGHDGDSHARIARMPDGTRGFGVGRGRPMTPPAP